MRKAIQQPVLEWSLVGAMLSLCVVLSVLQYRWTGDLARAESLRVQATLGQQVPRMGAAFDAAINTATQALLPEDGGVTATDWRTVNLSRWQRWKADPAHQPLFRRINVVVPNGEDLQLFEFTPGNELVEAPWPSEWGQLHNNLLIMYKREGFPRSMIEPLSPLLEFPIFGEDGEEHRELEWMVFELDLDYIQTQLIPKLSAEYLNPGTDAEFEVRLNEIGGKPDATVRVLRSGRSNHGEARWNFNIYRRGGALDAAIQSARWRNFSASLLLIFLTGGAGFALLRYTQRSRRLAETQFQFVAGISHEFRTPLTVIRGAAHNLLHGVVSDPKQVERYARAIIRNSDELVEMIESVLSAAGSDKRRAPRVETAVPVLETVDRAVDAASAEIEEAACEIELQIEPDLPPFCGDPAALRRIFQNLVSNAARHGGHGRWIGVTARAMDSSLEVQVTDRGAGIRPEDLPHIFEPFWRSERTRLDRIRGTGLGLSLTKELVEAHGGSITVESSPGHGTVFTVKLPAVKPGHYDEFTHTAG